MDGYPLADRVKDGLKTAAGKAMLDPSSTEAAFGWTWTTVTSLRCSLTHALKAIGSNS